MRKAAKGTAALGMLLLGLAGAAGDGAAMGDSVEPDPNLTPGRVMVNQFTGQPMTAEQICHVGYSKSVRDVGVELKRRAYEEYGIPYVRETHEVDHLVPLSIGGSNELANLWPQLKTGQWNSFVKDQLEFKLHRMVCARTNPLPLAQAQHDIATDWVAAYKKYVGPVPREAHVRENEEGSYSHRRRY